MGNNNSVKNIDPVKTPSVENITYRRQLIVAESFENSNFYNHFHLHLILRFLIFLLLFLIVYYYIIPSINKNNKNKKI